MRLNEDVCIICSKLLLVPYKKCHVPKYHSWMQSEELRQQTASERLTLEQEYEMQKSWHEDPEKCTFIILDKETYLSSGDEIEAMIGDVNLFFNDPDQLKSAEVEIMIAEESSRGKGVGTQAVLAMMRFGAERIDVTRYVTKIGITNHASLSMFEKLGFQEISCSEVFQEVTQELILMESTMRDFNLKLGNYTQHQYTTLNLGLINSAINISK